MKMHIKLFLLWCLVAASSNVTAQNFQQLDSLRRMLNEADHDTSRCEILLQIGDLFKFENRDSAIYYYNSSLQLADKKGYSKHYALSLRYIGIIHYYQGDYNKAFDYYIKSLRISKEIGDKKGVSAAYNNIGLVLQDQGDYSKAMEYFLESLKIWEEIGDKRRMSVCYNNIGNIHRRLMNFDKALEYYQRSLNIREEFGDKRGISGMFNNIGLVHKEQGTLLLSKGNQRQADHNFTKAIEYYLKSLKIVKELGDLHGAATVYGDIADLYITIAQADSLSDGYYEHLNKALEYGSKSLAIANQIHALPCQSFALKILISVNKLLGNYKKSTEYAEIFIITRDSMFNEEKTKTLAEMQTKYETEKKQQEIEKQKLIIEKQGLDNQHKQNQRNFFIACSVLLTLLVSVVLNGYQQKKRSNNLITVKNSMLEYANEEIRSTLETLSKQNDLLKEQYEEISKQRNEIEQQRNSLANLAWELQEKSEEIESQRNILSAQNKEITDSIVYAQRIQNAILPSPANMNQFFTEHFVLYKPKSIVSGDFYWVTRIRELLIFCVTDCTGHGVPGAFMSMMGVSFLNEIVRKEEVTNSAEVLNALRSQVIAALVEQDSSYVQFDGMDIGFCVLDTKTLKLQFAGANIPCWIVPTSTNIFPKSERTDQVNGLIELKPDRMPIARFECMRSFSLIECQLGKGDTIYLSSDGFADQFGGQSGKKFQKNRLMELLVQNCHLPLGEQKKGLENTFEQWKNSRNQIDDITILGVKV